MYIGLDLHKCYSQVAGMSADGDLVAEQRINNTKLELNDFHRKTSARHETS